MGPIGYWSDCAGGVLQVAQRVPGSVGIDFRKTHDLDTLAESVLPHFPTLTLRPLVTIMGSWTAWGVAYRYPGEDGPEPEPAAEELSGALDAITQLDAALRSLAPSPAGGASAARR
jgi:hypothetical protein